MQRWPWSKIRIERCCAHAVTVGGLIALVLLMASWPQTLHAANSKVEKLWQQAASALQSGKTERALELAEQAVQADTNAPRSYVLRGRIYSEMDQSAKAVADFDQAIKLDAGAPTAYQYRGLEQFKLGRIQESIADFDRYIEMVPKSDPYHWQRGISYYYAGRFEDGVKQFERHQTVNSQDVENAVWHFLCKARLSGLEEARKALIPITGDSRVPMKQVHALFAGALQPEAVLEAARAGKPSAPSLERNLFYAHLYLGLYFEAAGKEEKTREHIFKAEELSRDQQYMGAVARVHAARLREVKR